MLFQTATFHNDKVPVQATPPNRDQGMIQYLLERAFQVCHVDSYFIAAQQVGVSSLLDYDAN